MGRQDIIRGDRRAERRYEHRMELRFTYRTRGILQFGSGYTLDLSRAAVRFSSETPPPDGSEVELRIAWPFLLQNVCPLELVVRGTAMRTSDRGTVLTLHDYEFRTCGQRSFNQAVATAAGNSIIA